MLRSQAWMLLLSLLIALGLYVQLQPLSNAERELEFTVPLELRDLSPSQAVAQAPSSVRLLATGTPEQLRALDTAAFKAYCSIANAKVGKGAFVVQVVAPSGSQARVTPRESRLELNIEQRTQTQMNVEIETTGVLPNIYTYGGANIAPSRINVTGPESSVNLVNRLRILLNLASVRPQGSYSATVEALDKEGKPVPNIMLEPAEVTVSPAIASAPAGKQVIVNMIPKGEIAFGYMVVGYEISPKTIAVSGDADVLARFTTVETEPVDLSGLKEDARFEVNINVPPGVKSDVIKAIIVIHVAPSGTNQEPPANP